MTQRAKRTVRRASGTKAAATDRVVDVLMALRALGCARTSDLMLITGHPTRNAFNKWMRKLVDADYVHVSAEDLAEENSYALARPAWSLLAETFPELADLEPRAKREPSGHRLLLAAFWTQLGADVQKTATHRLSAWPEEVLRVHATGGLVPDLLVRLVADNVRAVTVAVEADAGTEPTKFIASKAEAYERLRVSGLLFGASAWRVAWVAPDAARAKWLEKTLGPESGGVEHLVASIHDIKAHGALACAWSVAGKAPATATLGGHVRGEE